MRNVLLLVAIMAASASAFGFGTPVFTNTVQSVSIILLMGQRDEAKHITFVDVMVFVVAERQSSRTRTHAYRCTHNMYGAKGL